MQRVISVKTTETMYPGTMDLTIRSSLTDGWGGTMIEQGNFSVARFAEGFLQTVQEFQAKTPITIPDAPPCDNCTLTVQVSDAITQPKNNQLRGIVFVPTAVQLWNFFYP